MIPRHLNTMLLGCLLAAALAVTGCDRKPQRVVAALPPTPTPTPAPTPTPTPRPAPPMVTPLPIDPSTTPSLIVSVTTTTLNALRHQLAAYDKPETTAIHEGVKLLMLDQIVTLQRFGNYHPRVQGETKEEYVEFGYVFQRHLHMANQAKSADEVRDHVRKMVEAVDNMERMTTATTEIETTKD